MKNPDVKLGDQPFRAGLAEPAFPELGPAANQRDFVDALYMSLVTLGTIGYGDISPATDVLRLIVPLEALVGFALLTASVSWVLTVYPALSRRRSLAYEITLLREVTQRSGAGDFVLRQSRSAVCRYGFVVPPTIALGATFSGNAAVPKLSRSASFASAR